MGVTTVAYFDKPSPAQMAIHEKTRKASTKRPSPPWIQFSRKLQFSVQLLQIVKFFWKWSQITGLTLPPKLC